MFMQSNRIYDCQKLSDTYKAIFGGVERYVIKAGTEVVTKERITDKQKLLDRNKIRDIAYQSAILHKQGNLVTIVSSGAVGAGMAKLGIKDLDRKEQDKVQALASTGQIDLITEYDAALKNQQLVAGQFLATYYDLTNPIHIKNYHKTSVRSRELGIIPIVNENDVFSVEEIAVENGYQPNGNLGSVSFGDNDRLSLMVAEILDSQILIFLMNEKGLMDYDKQKKVDIAYDLRGVESLFKTSSNNITKGGIYNKCKIAKEAANQGRYVIFTDGREDEVVLRMAKGEPLGTLILPKSI